MRIAVFRRFAVLFCLAFAGSFLLVACATPRQPAMPVGNLKLGTAFFSQPAEPSQMLAGYLVEDAPRIDPKILNEMDALLAAVLAANSKNNFHSRESALHCARTVAAQEGRSNNQAAIRTWSSIGRCMGVDILVVPQMLEYRERDGGALGAAESAHIVMDIFVLDVRNEILISRSRFDETQSPLTSNLLEADKFFRRGGKWVTARDLAEEGMNKAIKELGL